MVGSIVASNLRGVRGVNVVLWFINGIMALLIVLILIEILFGDAND